MCVLCKYSLLKGKRSVFYLQKMPWGIIKSRRLFCCLSRYKNACMDGLDFIVKAREIDPSMQFIMMTAYGSIERSRGNKIAL